MAPPLCSSQTFFEGKKYTRLQKTHNFNYLSPSYKYNEKQVSSCFKVNFENYKCSNWTKIFEEKCNSQKKSLSLSLFSLKSYHFTTWVRHRSFRFRCDILQRLKSTFFPPPKIPQTFVLKYVLLYSGLHILCIWWLHYRILNFPNTSFSNTTFFGHNLWPCQ